MKRQLRKNYDKQLESPMMSNEFILDGAKAFLQRLEHLHLELIARDAAYTVAKKSKQSADMEHYHNLAREVSQKCLDYGRELCESPVPQWVDGNLSKENTEITRHAYSVIRRKICASFKVFEHDLIPCAKILIDFAEGRH